MSSFRRTATEETLDAILALHAPHPDKAADEYFFGIAARELVSQATGNNSRELPQPPIFARSTMYSATRDALVGLARAGTKKTFVTWVSEVCLTHTGTSPQSVWCESSSLILIFANSWLLPTHARRTITLTAPSVIAHSLKDCFRQEDSLLETLFLMNAQMTDGAVG